MLGAVHVPVGGFRGSAVTQEVRHGGGSAFSRGWHKHWRMWVRRCGMLVRVGGAIDNDVVCHGGKGWYIYIYIYVYRYVYI